VLRNAGDREPPLPVAHLSLYGYFSFYRTRLDGELASEN
jgi:hypothetical protein